MRNFINATFWLTSIVYGITIFSVPYVGVYLTYVAVPVIVLSGLILWFTSDTPNESKVVLLENKIKRLERDNSALRKTITELRGGFTELHRLQKNVAKEAMEFVLDAQKQGYQVPETMQEDIKEVQKHLDTNFR